MIHELSDLGETTVIETDLCVVGSGAAGLTIAAELMDGPGRVLVLESGRHEPEAMDEELNALECIGLRHDGGREGRIRAFGGTTRAWGGQLMPYRHSEFESRPWVPHSGWPLDLDSLQPYYRRAESLLQVQGPPYHADVWTALKIAPPALDESQFCCRFSQWAPLARRNFAVMLRRRLAASKSVTVLLDATATAVHCEPNGAHANAIEVRSRTGRIARVRAKRFVLACGGIETARLLLASPGTGGEGVANRSGFVGRFFQDHISYIAGEVVPRSRADVQRLFDPRYVARTMFTAKIEATDRLQRERQLLNVMGHLAFQIPEALGLLEVKRLLRALQAGNPAVPSFDELRAMIRGGGELVRLILGRLIRQRRLSPTTGGIFLLVDVEQAPNPQSRVVLDDRKDRLGMRKAVLDWRIGELEAKTLREYSRLLAREIERLGLGSVRLAGPPQFGKRNGPGAARDIFHHMGTARMSISPHDGVTNTDLRCHDVDNLYVASAAVFPASGVSNPTLTVIALSMRLADHLNHLLARDAT